MNITKLIQPIDAATGRNRTVALKEIHRQLKKIRSSARDMGNAPFEELKLGDLQIIWGAAPDGMSAPTDIYFRITRGRTPMMTGWMNDSEILHVMSWKRGFEAGLYQASA